LQRSLSVTNDVDIRTYDELIGPNQNSLNFTVDERPEVDMLGALWERVVKSGD
jgi:hypothetical protein